MRSDIPVRIVVLFACLGAADRATGQVVGPSPATSPMTSQTLSAAAEGPPLSLDDAVREAVANNADLAAVRTQVDPLRTKPAQARVLAPPTLTAQIWQWPINTFNPANTNMYMFMASQELPGRGKRAAAVTAAAADISVAERTVDTRERDIVRAVTDAYWNLLIARQAITIHLASVDLLHQLADVAQVKYAAGRVSQQDVLKAIVETTRLHSDLVDLELEAEHARLQLNALMRRPLDAPIGALTDPGPLVLRASLSDVQALASQSQPELSLARAQIERARTHVALARTTSTSDWTVGAGYMLQPHQTDAWLANVSVTWPRAPWSRGAIDARTAEATASVGAAEADAVATETRIRLAIADAFARVKSAEARAALLSTTLLPQARQILQVSRVAYETDRVDFLGIIDNERTLLDSELAYERALSEWRHAVTDLERAVGTTLPATMLRPASTPEVKR